jgi:hypothetical protein
MSISAIYAQSIDAVTSSTAPASDPSQPAPANGSPATSTSISQPGQLLSQLQQLATSDPAKFKQVTANIASQLQEAAQHSTAALQPAGHHGGHHHGGGEHKASSTTDSTADAGATSSSTQTQSAAAGYFSQSTNPFAEASNIIQQALSGSLSTTASTT